MSTSTSKRIIVQDSFGKQYNFKTQGSIREDMTLGELRKTLEKENIMEKDDLFQTSDTHINFPKGQEAFTILKEDFLIEDSIKVSIHRPNDDESQLVKKEGQKTSRKIVFKNEQEGNLYLSNLDEEQREKLLNNCHYLYGINITQDLQRVTGMQLFFENNDENKKFEQPFFSDRNSMTHVEQKLTAENISEAKNKLSIGAKLLANISFLSNAGLSAGYKNDTSKQETSKKDLQVQIIVVEKGEIQLSGIRSVVSSKVKNYFKPGQEISKDNVRQFFDIFGTYIPTKITIGGRFVSQKSTQEKNSVENKENDKNFGVNTGTNTPISGSIEMSRTKESKKEEKNQEENVSIQTVGGDIAFSKDQEAWVKSIHKDYQSWEIISIDNYVYSYELLEEPFRSQVSKIMHSIKINNTNGDSFEGTYDDDGKINGKYIQSNGNIFEGEWKFIQKEGKGNLILKNGDIFEVELKDDKMIGNGKYIYSNGSTYEGEWKNNLRDGKGKSIYKTGGIYEGEWKNNKANGQGIFYYSSGDVYEGEWKDHVREGKGKYTWKNGDVYEGEWKNHMREGNGKIIFPHRGSYNGEWKNDKMNGKGKYIWKNGDIYEGDWKDNLKDGQGKLSYKDGDILEGEWKDDKFIENKNVIFSKEKFSWRNIKLGISPDEDISKAKLESKEIKEIVEKTKYVYSKENITGILQNKQKEIIPDIYKEEFRNVMRSKRENLPIQCVDMDEGLWYAEGC